MDGQYLSVPLEIWDIKLFVNDKRLFQQLNKEGQLIAVIFRLYFSSILNGQYVFNDILTPS